MARIVLILCTGFIALATHAQHIDQILSHHRNATYKSGDSTILHSTYAQGISCYHDNICFPLQAWAKGPNKTRLEMDVHGSKYLIVSNDSLTWESNPVTKENNIIRHDRENKSFNAMYISNDLLNYPRNGYTITYEGEEKIDSIDVFVLRLYREDNEKIISINQRDFLINKISEDGESTFFLNYHIVNDFVYPGRIVYQNGNQEIELRLDEVEFNALVPDSLFEIKASSAYLGLNKKGKSEFENLIAEANREREHGHSDRALELFDKAIKLNDKSDIAFNSRGLVKMDAKLYYDAISDFTRALEINPKNSSALNNRGLSKYYMGDFTNALIDFDKALLVDHQKSVTHTNRGLANLGLRNFSEAYLDFTKAIYHDPLNGNNYLNRGITLSELSRYGEAIDDYYSSITLGIKTAQLFNYKGISEYTIKQYDSAVASFERAVELDPENLKYRENLARTHYERGNYDEANKQLDHYLKEEPNNDEIINLVGLCSFFQQHYRVAIKHFSKAIEVNPNNAVYFDNRAEARQSIDDFEGAISDYDQSIRLFPNDPETFYKRGIVKILTSKKMEGCLDLATANEMKYLPAKEAILENCH